VVNPGANETLGHGREHSGRSTAIYPTRSRLRPTSNALLDQVEGTRHELSAIAADGYQLDWFALSTATTANSVWSCHTGL
jgi:hypothetical protein